MFKLVLLQAQNAAESLEGGEEMVKEESLSWISLVLEGGFIMIPLFAMLAWAIFVFIERYLTIKKATKISPDFMDNIRSYVVAGDIDGAMRKCSSTNSPLARLVEKGLTRIGRPLESIDTAIENTGKLQVYQMEKNISSLASIAGAAPMIGFFGTVIGMIGAFFNLSQAGGEGNADLLANDIYTALVTTATGLFVGIPAFLGYNFLNGMIEKAIFKMEAITLEFIDLLQEPSK